MGIDDFAYRKGQVYGSVIVDLATGKPLDVLDSRDSETVRKWFDAHPSVQYVSRDGGLNFKKGIGASSTGVTQIRDRFHLLADLGRYVDSFVKRQVRTFEWRPQEAVPDRDLLHQEFCRHMLASARPEAKRKYERHVTFCEMKSKGYSIRQIAERIGVTTANVHRYKDMRLRNNIPAVQQPLYRHLQTIIPQIINGEVMDESDICRLYPDITPSAVKGLDVRIEKVREAACREKQAGHKLEKPSRQEVFKTFFVEGYRTGNRTLETIRKGSVQFRQFAQACVEFRRMMNGNTQICPLSKWIKKVKAYRIRELDRFLKMIEADLEAVENAINMPWSNGILEGTVNKIKAIKRTVYGRACAALLKMKLMREYST